MPPRVSIHPEDDLASKTASMSLEPSRHEKSLAKDASLQTLGEFHLFRELPVELRLMIWSLCWTPVVARYERKRGGYINKNLAILAVCKEARDELLRKLIYITDRKEDYAALARKRLVWVGEARLLMHPDFDILALSSGMEVFIEGSGRKLQWKAEIAPLMHRIQRVAFACETEKLRFSGDEFPWGFYAGLHPEVREIYMVGFQNWKEDYIPAEIDKLEAREQLRVFKVVIPKKTGYTSPSEKVSLQHYFAYLRRVDEARHSNFTDMCGNWMSKRESRISDSFQQAQEKGIWKEAQLKYRYVSAASGAQEGIRKEFASIRMWL